MVTTGEAGLFVAVDELSVTRRVRVTNMKRVAKMQDASSRESENDIISQSVDRRVEWPRPRIAEE